LSASPRNDVFLGRDKLEERDPLTVFLTVSDERFSKKIFIYQTIRRLFVLLPKETNWPGRRLPGHFFTFQIVPNMAVTY
jgi:hypothetical protein